MKLVMKDNQMANSIPSEQADSNHRPIQGGPKTALFSMHHIHGRVRGKMNWFYLHNQKIHKTRFKR